MHVSDALISPAVAIGAAAISIILLAVAVKKIKNDYLQIASVMGIMGAFVFAAQMINFTIPGTGSSGHIIGGILLAAVLGPWAAYITLASILILQAFIFADGGILALGCNLLNMGLTTCLIAFPLLFKPFVKQGCSTSRLIIISTISSLVGLELGAFLVTIETELSGITALPFSKFLLFMLPIHFLIGCIEGIATGTILSVARKYRPEIINIQATPQINKKTLVIFSISAILMGGVVSWYASSYPDGLEWSIEKTTGNEEISDPEASSLHTQANVIQQNTALMPDYSFRSEHKQLSDAQIKAGTSLSGIAGALILIILAIATRFIFANIKRRHNAGS